MQAVHLIIKSFTCLQLSKCCYTFLVIFRFISLSLWFGGICIYGLIIVIILQNLNIYSNASNMFYRTCDIFDKKNSYKWISIMLFWFIVGWLISNRILWRVQMWFSRLVYGLPWSAILACTRLANLCSFLLENLSCLLLLHWLYYAILFEKNDVIQEQMWWEYDENIMMRINKKSANMKTH